MDLKNKIAVVTGGSSGIGKAISIALAKEGCKVIFTYNSSEKDANKTLEEIGENAINYKLDLQVEKEIEKFFDFVEGKFGRLDILVNNAGYGQVGEVFDRKLWEQSFEVNVLGTVTSTKFAVKIMGNGGRILNISSIYGEDKAAWQGKAAYSASKSAVNNLTRTFAKELAPNILVNAVAPGYVDTKVWEQFSRKIRDSSKDELLIGRLIRPEEIAQMSVAIIKNDAMTGEVVVVDGGLSLKTV